MVAHCLGYWLDRHRPVIERTRPQCYNDKITIHKEEVTHDAYLRELKHKTVAELRDIAKGIEHEAVQVRPR